MSDPKLDLIAPIFPVTDVQRSRDYYRDKLGFDVAFEWSDEEGGPVRYVIIRKNDCDLHLSQSDTGQKSAAYFFVDGVENYYTMAKENGAVIVQEIKDWPWGMREFEASDPDGNRLTFGQDISQ